jgi:UDP-glucose 4-epimerase
MHIIITGGLGFIGSNIAARLLNEGHQVTILDNLATSIVSEIPGTGVINLDLTNGRDVADISLPEADCLMHLARSSSGPESVHNPLGVVTEGYTQTYNALLLAKRAGVKRVIHASTMTVYGDIDPKINPVNETTPCLPLSYYGIGKFANERLIEIFCRSNGIGFNNLRMFNVYGNDANGPVAAHGLVGVFVDMLMKSPHAVSHGPLERFRDLVHVRDVVTAWVLCATKNNQDGPFNVGSGQSITFKEMITAIAEELGIADQLTMEVDAGTPGDMFGVVADISAIQAATGYTSVVSPVRGVKSFTRWAMGHIAVSS